jgi:hypothetical protein
VYRAILCSSWCVVETWVIEDTHDGIVEIAFRRDETLGLQPNVVSLLLSEAKIRNGFTESPLKLNEDFADSWVSTRPLRGCAGWALSIAPAFESG